MEMLALAPILIINPRADEEFVSAVEQNVPSTPSPDALQQRLRSSYPRVVVRRRDLAGEMSEIWYVYRDGRWTPGRPMGDGGKPA